MIRRLGLSLFILLVATLVVGTGWLAGTSAGARVVIAWTSALLPNVKLRHEGGVLLGPLHLREVDVRAGQVRVRAENLRLDWAPGCLLVAEACVRDLQASRLSIRMPAAKPARPGAPPRPLPQPRLPLTLDVGHLAIGELDIVRGDRRTSLRDITAAFRWQGSDLRVDRFALSGAAWTAAASGQLTVSGDWPVAASLQFRVPRAGAVTFALAGRAGDTLRETKLVLDSSGVVDSHLEGVLRTMVPGMPFTLAATAASLRVPPGATDDRATRIEDVQLSATGELTGTFRIDGRGRIDTPWTPPLPTSLAVTATLRGITEGRVRLDDPKLQALLETRWDWIGGQRFVFDADIAHLDLSLFNPALSSRLAGRAGIDGSVVRGSQRVTFDIARIAGTLGTRQLATRGRARWEDGLLHFDGLDVDQGVNRARLDGRLDEAWAVNAELALDDLSTLVPGFEGTARGHARITGHRTDPRLAFTLASPALGLPAVPLPAPADRELRLPVTAWDVVGEASLRDVVLAEARTRDAGFALSATGQVGWTRGLRWDLATRLGQFPLARLAPELGGLVDGNFDTRGELADGLHALAIDTRLTGGLDDWPLAVSARLDYGPGEFAVPILSLRHGPNRLEASGRLAGGQIALDLSVDAPGLGESLRDAGGSLSATARVSGPASAPDGVASLAGTAVRLGPVSFASLSTTAALAQGGHGHSRVTTAARGLALGSSVPLDGALFVEGSRTDLSADLDLRHEGLEATLGVRGALDPAFAWSGQLSRGVLQWRDWRWSLVGMPSLDIRDGSGTLGPHCWTDEGARACITAPAILGESGYVQAEAFHLSPGRLIAESLPAEAIVTGTVGAIASARWTQGRIDTLAADIRNGAPIRFGERLDSGRERIAATVDSLAAMLDMTPAGAVARVEAAGDTLGTLSATANLSRSDGRLAGSLTLAEGNLSIANAFAWQVQDIGGRVDVDLTLGGTLEAPALSGRAALHDGRGALVRAPLALEQVQLAGEFDGERMRLSGRLRTPDSRADVEVGGEFALHGRSWHGAARARGNDFVVALPPQYRFALAPDLTLRLDDRTLHLSGDVKVPEGRIDLKALPERSVPRSRDVIIFREDELLGAEDPVFTRSMDVLVTLGDDVQFKAFGAEGGLAGNLRVRLTPALPLLVDGELRIIDGEYSVFGQSLQLRQADIIFNGPADQPLVDAVAFREIGDPSLKEVGVRLSGSLRRPETTLWSTPELPQEQALTWLLTGHGPSDDPVDYRGDAAQAALALGVAQGSALLNQAGQQLGLNELQLSAGGDGEDTEVQVGTALNDRIYVGYNRRVFSGEQSLLVRLRMTRRLVLEALSGLESAVDVFYTFEY